jgi:hypothetical protein
MSSFCQATKLLLDISRNIVISSGENAFWRILATNPSTRFSHPDFPMRLRNGAALFFRNAFKR